MCETLLYIILYIIYFLKRHNQAKIIKKSVKVFKKFCSVHLPVKRDIKTKFLFSYFGHACTCSSSLWTCLHHMVIIKSQNKITDFLMILA